MKKLDKTEVLIWAFAAAPLVLTAAALPFLPQLFPVHWGLDGQPDGWGGVGQLLIMTGTGLASALLLKFLPFIDPKRKNYDRFAGGYRALRLCFSVFYFFMTCIMLAGALWPGLAAYLPVDRLVTVGVGLLLCVMGNFMPKFKHNYFCGVKTPWALADEENWRLTHRFAGPIWFWGGLLIALCALVLRGGLLAAAVGVGVGAMVLAPTLYSYLIFKKGANH